MHWNPSRRSLESRVLKAPEHSKHTQWPYLSTCNHDTPSLPSHIHTLGSNSLYLWNSWCECVLSMRQLVWMCLSVSSCCGPCRHRTHTQSVIIYHIFIRQWDGLCWLAECVLWLRRRRKITGMDDSMEDDHWNGWEFRRFYLCLKGSAVREWTELTTLRCTMLEACGALSTKTTLRAEVCLPVSHLRELLVCAESDTAQLNGSQVTRHSWSNEEPGWSPQQLQGQQVLHMQSPWSHRSGTFLLLPVYCS